MREVEGINGVADALERIDGLASEGAGDPNRIFSVEIKLGVEELRAKAPMRFLGTKARQARAIVRR